MADTGFKIDGVVYPIPLGDYTFEEAGGIEEITGLTMFEFSSVMEESQAEGTPPSVRFLTALLWVSMHRQDPTVTIKQVKRLKIDAFDFEGGDDGPPANGQPEERSSGPGEENEDGGSKPSTSQADGESQTEPITDDTPAGLGSEETPQLSGLPG